MDLEKQSPAPGSLPVAEEKTSPAHDEAVEEEPVVPPGNFSLNEMLTATFDDSFYGMSTGAVPIGLQQVADTWCPPEGAFPPEVCATREPSPAMGKHEYDPEASFNFDSFVVEPLARKNPKKSTKNFLNARKPLP